MENAPAKNKNGLFRRILILLGKFIAILLETVLLLAILLLGIMYVLAKGPSETAGAYFVRSVQETSAIGFLANIYYSQEEIDALTGAGEEDIYYEPTDSSLITISDTPEIDEETGADAWGLIDDDGDGIIVEQVHGSGYSGYMMVVLDPTRVIMGTVPESYCVRGYTVAEMVERFDAVAGVNAGGFYDPEGHGNGSIPDSLVVYEGEIYYENAGISWGFAGLDSNSILHVGKMTADEIREADIQYGVCFGPALVINGEAAPEETLASGVNPRTAIGQRSDGAILLLVIDGRQVISLGATYTDLAEIFLSYGAVQACNLDGGSSSLMWYQGDYINSCSSVVGIRPIPTTFLVLKEGASGSGDSIEASNPDESEKPLQDFGEVD